jgi:phosphatidylserine/phosphatidylglycerophosphate/cardiolipin synthase-like enzyme
VGKEYKAVCNFGQANTQQSNTLKIIKISYPDEKMPRANFTAISCIQLRAGLRGPGMRLIVQPEDGVKPLVDGINHASKSVEIVIFRFDRKEVEHALENAVKRGVFVHTLIADTNRSGERNLRIILPW